MRIYKARTNQHYVITMNGHYLVATTDKQHRSLPQLELILSTTENEDKLNNVGVYEPLGEYPDNGEEANALRSILVEYCKRVTS